MGLHPTVHPTVSQLQKPYQFRGNSILRLAGESAYTNSM